MLAEWTIHRAWLLSFAGFLCWVGELTLERTRPQLMEESLGATTICWGQVREP